MIGLSNCPKVLVVLPIVLAFWTPVNADDTFNLKRIYKIGESDKYRTSITVDTKDPTGKAAQVVLTISTTDETKEMKFDGTTVISMKVDSATVSLDGNPKPVPINGSVFTITLDKAGKVISQDLGGGFAAAFGQLVTLTRLSMMPDKALKAGETFKFETENKSKVSVMVVGKEPKSDEVNLESINVRLTIDAPSPDPQATDRVKIAATSLLEPGTGKALKTDGTLDGPLGALAHGSKVSFKVLRLSGGGK